MSIPPDIVIWKQLKELCGWITPEDLEELKNTPTADPSRVLFQMKIVYRNTFVVKALVGLKKKKRVCLWGMSTDILEAFKERTIEACSFLEIDPSPLYVQKMIPDNEEDLYDVQIIGMFRDTYNLLPVV